MKHKVVDTRTGKTFLANFKTVERAQYRIDHNIDKAIAPFMQVVPQQPRKASCSKSK